MSKRRGLLFRSIMAIAVISTLAACGQATPAPSNAAPPVATAAPAQATTAPTKESVKLGYVVHVTGVEFTAIVQEGAEAAAKDYGVDMVFTGPPATDNTAQIAAFDALVQAGTKGIVFIAGDPSVWAEPVKRAVDKGVVVLNADADAPDTQRLAFFGVDAKGLGRKLGDAVRALLEKEGKLDGAKIVLGECVIGPAPHVLREQGVREAFQGANVTFLGPYETVCDATQNYANWQNAYTAHQDAAAFVGLTAVETASLGKLKQETGGKFIVGSFDPGAEGLRLMKEGYIDVAVGQNPYLAGYLPIQALAKHFLQGAVINPGINLYPGEVILPKDADTLIPREGGGQVRTDWYTAFMKQENLGSFALK